MVAVIFFATAGGGTRAGVLSRPRYIPMLVQTGAYIPSVYPVRCSTWPSCMYHTCVRGPYPLCVRKQHPSPTKVPYFFSVLPPCPPPPVHAALAVVARSSLITHQDGPREGDLPLPPPRPQISVAGVSRGAELWGYVERVTNMGAYVNVGAEVPGFLLLKEIPGRPKVGWCKESGTAVPSRSQGWKWCLQQ